MPTPILIVSASTNRGELFKTYDALAAGAIDVLEKPTVDNVDTSWERGFVAAVKLVARIKVITHVRARLSGTEQAVATVPGRKSTKRGYPICRNVFQIAVICMKFDVTNGSWSIAHERIQGEPECHWKSSSCLSAIAAFVELFVRCTR
jgi:chemotaxis response regulator CheB